MESKRALKRVVIGMVVPLDGDRMRERMRERMTRLLVPKMDALRLPWRPIDAVLELITRHYVRLQVRELARD